jgi:hypothetical protein
VRGDRLPPQHHVARHCRKNDLIWSGAVATGILECALMPRAQENDGLSSTWLEFFGGDRQHNMSGVRRHIGLTPKQSNRLAVINVGNIETVRNPAALYVIEDPYTDPPPGNPAHALIKEPANLQQDQKLREAIALTVQASDIEPY